jgi:uncharacterized protein YndB with AHSA1/START domain
MSAADAVTVAIDIDVAPDVAFDVFTRELDAWWGRGPRFRFVAPFAGRLTLEAGVGGRLLHAPDGIPEGAFVVGRVEAWEPPRRLAFTWRLANFAPDQVTRVDVCFDPAEDGTRVSITHSGWDTIPPTHPARHGLTDRAFVLWKGQWWADLLTAAKRHMEGHTPVRKDGR